MKAEWNTGGQPLSLRSSMRRLREKMQYGHGFESAYSVLAYLEAVEQAHRDVVTLLLKREQERTRVWKEGAD